MAFQPLTDFITEPHAGRAAHLFADIPTIRILIYTDDPQVVDDAQADFGIGLMKQFLDAHQPTFARIAPPVLESRNTGDKPEEHAAKKLLNLLPCGDYDQIWFFGVHMANLTDVVWFPPDDRGGPKSELTDLEVAYLRDEWMNTGGVLVTGDHSELQPPKVEDSTLPATLSLGRALGHRVPRASQLRTWNGGPGSDPMSSYDTQEPNNAKDLERDEKPQKLILSKFDAEGKPKSDGKPHFLFTNKDKGEIEVFPDHMHEGKVSIPDKLNGDWPAGGPEPLVVAKGTNKQKGDVYDLVAVYDGHLANVGRIVVDSTWHHYFKMNLEGFKQDLGEGSPADLIGQYYSNLAVWLTPVAKLRKMTQAMFWWLANHPRIMEESSGSSLAIGKVAWRLFSRTAAPHEIHELLRAYTHEKVLAQFPMLRYPEHASDFSPFPSQELILGAVIKEYHQEMTTVSDDKLLETKGKREVGVVIEAGIKRAFEMHAEMLSGVREKALHNFNLFA